MLSRQHILNLTFPLLHTLRLSHPPFNIHTILFISHSFHNGNLFAGRDSGKNKKKKTETEEWKEIDERRNQINKAQRKVNLFIMLNELNSVRMYLQCARSTAFTICVVFAGVFENLNRIYWKSCLLDNENEYECMCWRSVPILNIYSCSLCVCKYGMCIFMRLHRSKKTNQIFHQNSSR